MYVDGVQRYIIRSLISHFRSRGLFESGITQRTYRILRIMNGVINGVLAFLGGALFTFDCLHQAVVSLKVATCLATVGYYLRIISWPSNMAMVYEVLAQQYSTGDSGSN